MIDKVKNYFWIMVGLAVFSQTVIGPVCLFVKMKNTKAVVE